MPFPVSGRRHRVDRIDLVTGGEQGLHHAAPPAAAKAATATIVIQREDLVTALRFGSATTNLKFHPVHPHSGLHQPDLIRSTLFDDEPQAGTVQYRRPTLVLPHGNRTRGGRSGCKSIGYRAGMTTDPRETARTLDDAQRQRARLLIQRLKDPTLPDEAGAELLDELTRMLLYPTVSDLLFWRTPELTEDEVIDEALQFQPFTG
jgi:hypothetical protein